MFDFYLNISASPTKAQSFSRSHSIRGALICSRIFFSRCFKRRWSIFTSILSYTSVWIMFASTWRGYPKMWPFESRHLRIKPVGYPILRLGYGSKACCFMAQLGLARWNTCSMFNCWISLVMQRCEDRTKVEGQPQREWYHSTGLREIYRKPWFTINYIHGFPAICFHPLNQSMMVCLVDNATSS
jgi:hypothetical protein